jgi:cytochrome P450
MNELFSPSAHRNPYPFYDRMRQTGPVHYDGSLWYLLDYQSVKHALSNHETFSSRLGPAEWMIFLDPPQHTKLRALVSQAFTPRSVANLEPGIRLLACELLERGLVDGELDLVEVLSGPLPMLVIAELLGVPKSDQTRFHRWNNVVLRMSYTIAGSPECDAIRKEYNAATAEMDQYLSLALEERRSQPADDLLSRLAEAQVDGERLTRREILGFFQLLLLAASETTTNLVSNAVLCFLENSDQFRQLRAEPELLPSAIEEVLRHRSPLQWMFRLAKRDVHLHGYQIPAGAVVLALMGSANRDPQQFHDPDRFDLRRNPNPHVAFGHGIHSCLGAALARLEAKVALREFLARVGELSLATNDPLEPRQGLHVHGPAHLPLRVSTRAA